MLVPELVRSLQSQDRTWLASWLVFVVLQHNQTIGAFDVNRVDIHRRNDPRDTDLHVSSGRVAQTCQSFQSELNQPPCPPASGMQPAATRSLDKAIIRRVHDKEADLPARYKHSPQIGR